jgi:hypothetical protein
MTEELTQENFETKVQINLYWLISGLFGVVLVE